MGKVAEQFWDSIADEWRRRRTPNDALMARILANLGCPPGGIILDAGCGAGALSVPLAAHGYHLHGIDVSPRMIANAREAATEQALDDDAARFQVGDVARLPFPDITFDAMICVNVLDFAPRPGVALVEFQRVLKPGARLLLMTLGASSPVKREWWQRFLPDATEERVRNYILPWEMESLLEALGWQIIAQEPIFGRSFDGGTSPYTPETAAALTDRVLQQTIAGSWWFTALKPPQESS